MKRKKIILTIFAFVLILFALLGGRTYARFDLENLSIKVGEIKSLNVKTNISNYYCTSSNEEIVRILNTCDVYGVSVGNASVSVNAGSLSNTINVSVLDDKEEYFDFDNSSYTMNIGDSYKLLYKTNIENISFKASNDNITIKNNIVYANKAGTTIIKFEHNNLSKAITININGKTIKATFDKGNSNGLSEYSKFCQINEVNGSCNINLPYINSSDDYDIIGFTNENSTYNEGTIVSIKQNTTFVAEVKNKNKITINYIGNGSNISRDSDTCYGSSCNITLPNITRDGYEILGFNTSKSSTSIKYKVGDNITINQNTNFYAITRKKIYATFLNDNVVTITKPNNYEYTNNSVKTYCTIYNEENSCYINAPTNISINDNYEFAYFKGDKEYKLGEKIYLTQNYVFKPIYKIKEENNDITIYVSPKGNDNNNGLSSKYAVKTLDRVQKILKSSNNIKNVYVKIEPGTYYNEHTIWNYYNGYNIRFMSSGTTKPVYKGNNSTLPWFSISLNNTSLVDLKISFYNIKVDSYFTGISIIGGTGKVKNITIDSMLFSNIGSKGMNTSYVSRECIKIKNASNVSIINNTFTNLLNNENEKVSHSMSAIRLYNTSSSLIKENNIYNVDGDGIILENASSNNLINSNTFTLTGYLSFITEYYYSNYKKCTNNNVTNNNFISGINKYKVLKTSIIENGNKLYYNEEFTDLNKNFYNNLDYTLIKSNYTTRFKVS